MGNNKEAYTRTERTALEKWIWLWEKTKHVAGIDDILTRFGHNVFSVIPSQMIASARIGRSNVYVESIIPFRKGRWIKVEKHAGSCTVKWDQRIWNKMIDGNDYDFEVIGMIDGNPLCLLNQGNGAELYLADKMIKKWPNYRINLWLLLPDNSVLVGLGKPFSCCVESVVRCANGSTETVIRDAYIAPETVSELRMINGTIWVGSYIRITEQRFWRRLDTYSEKSELNAWILLGSGGQILSVNLDEDRRLALFHIYGEKVKSFAKARYKSRGMLLDDGRFACVVHMPNDQEAWMIDDEIQDPFDRVSSLFIEEESGGSGCDLRYYGWIHDKVNGNVVMTLRIPEVDK